MKHTARCSAGQRHRVRPQVRVGNDLKQTGFVAADSIGPLGSIGLKRVERELWEKTAEEKVRRIMGQDWIALKSRLVVISLSFSFEFALILNFAIMQSPMLGPIQLNVRQQSVKHWSPLAPPCLAVYWSATDPPCHAWPPCHAFVIFISLTGWLAGREGFQCLAWSAGPSLASYIIFRKFWWKNQVSQLLWIISNFTKLSEDQIFQFPQHGVELFESPFRMFWVNHKTSQLTCTPTYSNKVASDCFLFVCKWHSSVTKFVAEVVKELCASSQPTQIKLRLIVCMWLACLLYLLT